MRRTRWAARAFVAVAVTSATLAAAVPSASAVAPVELALAVAETNVAIGLAAVDVALANASDTNVTCGIPTVWGSNVTPAVDARAAIVRGNDVAVAKGECASLTMASYTVELLLTVQFRDPSGQWENYCAASGSGSSVDGTAAVYAVAHCWYGPGSPPDGRPHRARAELRTSVSPVPFVSYSEPWQG